MSFSAHWQLPVTALAAATKTPVEISNTVVVFTGITLVFFILLILILLITLQGKIFASMEKKKQDQSQPVQPPPAPVAAPAPAPVSAPVVEEGIPPEIVAAIIAAVSAATEGAYTLRAVKTSKQGRGQWGLAGVLQNTEPF